MTPWLVVTIGFLVIGIGVLVLIEKEIFGRGED